jgi:hypothetical protein
MRELASARHMLADNQWSEQLLIFCSIFFSFINMFRQFFNICFCPVKSVLHLYSGKVTKSQNKEQSFCLFSVLKELQTFDIVDGNKWEKQVYCSTFLIQAVLCYSNCLVTLPSLRQVIAFFKRELVAL